MSNTISISACWYKDRDKPSNWTAKLTIIKLRTSNRIIYNHFCLFNNLTIAINWRTSIWGLRISFRCQWYVFYWSSFYFFSTVSTTIMSRRRRDKRTKKRIKLFIWNKKIKFKCSGFLFSPQRVRPPASI